ncbi:hypothetical protein GCM10010441_42330 [Kitasatospora paracochleata]|uniref:Superfamily II DNA or RNA helicase n=1 Tax=Kitasatospora paracochleata TaxID=58354 RepID=A0ABT1JAI9_9ACTN|nr:hypothetical protein [Kitasatospora paracochleata]MCP2314224.1 superfamily II DNA or RNA helicase [Kitasatospora paracochleata]
MKVVSRPDGRSVGCRRSLRGHQEEGLEAIVRGLTPRPGHSAPNGLRVTVQMAVSSGRSYVAAVAGHQLVPRGVVLVVVPALDLLVQMIGSWRAAGRGAGPFGTRGRVVNRPLQGRTGGIEGGKSMVVRVGGAAVMWRQCSGSG